MRIYVAVCYQCRRAFVSAARLERIPAHEYPIPPGTCSGSNAPARVREFTVNTPSGVQPDITELTDDDDG